MTESTGWKRQVWYVPLVIVTTIWLFPIYWMLVTSLKSDTDLASGSPQFIFKPTFQNYVNAFTQSGFGRYLLHSLLIVSGTTIAAMLIGSMAAYSLARLRLPAAQNVGMWILSLRMIPPIVTVIPFYLLWNQLGLLDSYLGMFLVYLSFSLPFAIWMLQGFFSELPSALDEAATADGLSPFQILFRIIIPLSKGGMAVTAIFTFIFAWNEFLFALMLTRVHWTTVPAVIGNTFTPYQVLWGALSAESTLSMIPLLILVFLFQRQIVRGVSFGAIK